ncbi:MFS transporter [Salinisphaera sp. Q1T1-3]|uniref:MFS transporter n=1 Tax=Salinisphaera sp. Q1T1-3 TaxID=2321229 RepID=UPI000E77193A|nr:MFS transporter [Salinisphaera sp. Q1T1-3]RJS93079.1 MFS transporter [Salinisphaera sp. Q1T1-3]
MPNRVLQVLVFIALATGGFAIGTTEFGTMSLLPLIQQAFSINESTASHIISAYALGVVVGAPIITVLAARISRKPLLVGLMAVFAIGNGLSALAPSYPWLVVFRFISGLPHGAYFGLASLVAASIVKPHRRTQAVGYVMLGLTLATILGVPAATWLANITDWRAGYWSVTAIALAACLLIVIFAPYQGAHGDAHPLRELSALARPNVWLTLSIGAIGFGGVFAVYTYLTTTLSNVTHMSAQWAPVVLGVFGVGMTVGNMVIPRFADRAQMPTAGAMLVWSMLALLAFPLASHNAWTVTLDVFLIGISVSLAAILQTRLMDVAGDAQNLAAALNHVAFNAANALGPFLAGVVLAYGYGAEVAGYVGAALCVGGLIMWAITWAYDKRTGHDPHPDSRSSVTNH